MADWLESLLRSGVFFPGAQSAAHFSEGSRYHSASRRALGYLAPPDTEKNATWEPHVKHYAGAP